MSSDAQAEDQAAFNNLKYEYEKLKKEFASFAERTIDEIEELRAEINYLQPKASAYDHITALTGVISDLRQRPRSSKEDFLWAAKSRKKELEK